MNENKILQKIKRKIFFWYLYNKKIKDNFVWNKKGYYFLFPNSKFQHYGDYFFLNQL